MKSEGNGAKNILIVDDDRALGEMLSIVLQNEGFDTVICQDGIRATQIFPAVQPDLILLDVMLPGFNGVEVASRIRQTSNVPIIMLTAKSDTVDVVAGLEAGADDYVSKPFNATELMARIRARFRVPSMGSEALEQSGQNEESLTRGEISIDRRSHIVTKSGRELKLTPMEFELLYVLAKDAGQVFSRQELLKLVWGYENSRDTKLINVYVQRLRAKIEHIPEDPHMVQTVRGIGYRFVADHSDE